MAVVEELRKTMQDLIAPDLRAIEVRLKSLEDVVKTRLDSADQLASARHTAVVALVEKQQVQSEARHKELLQALEFDTRLRRLEVRDKRRQTKPSQPEQSRTLLSAPKQL